MTRHSLGVLLVGAALLASGCKAKPTTLQVEPASLKFTATGETMMLLVTVLDEKGKPVEHAPCLFASSDGAVADVKQDGTVVSVGAGSTSIRVSCGELAAVSSVRVRLPTTIKLDLDCDKRCNLQSSDPLTFKLEVLGAVAQLKSQVLDDEGKPVEGKVRFEARDPDFHTGVRGLGVEIDDDGRVTARGVGKFMIIASAGGAVGKANVEVVMPVVDVVKVERASILLKPGEEAKVAATTYQRTIHGLRKVVGARLAWQSSNKQVAVVDDDGKIKALDEGFADVVVAADSGAFAQVGVRVDKVGKQAPKVTAKPKRRLSKTKLKLKRKRGR